MLHPSYSDLINKVNGTVEEGEAPLVQSRYSIVIASAKRARQLIDGRPATIKTSEGKKPLSVAVEELDAGTLKLSREGETPVFDDDVISVEETTGEEMKSVEIEEEVSGTNSLQSALTKMLEAVGKLDDADAGDFENDDFDDEE